MQKSNFQHNFMPYGYDRYDEEGDNRQLRWITQLNFAISFMYMNYKKKMVGSRIFHVKRDGVDRFSPDFIKNKELQIRKDNLL